MVELRDVFADYAALMQLEPEELGGILVEVISSAIQHDKFTFERLMHPLYPKEGGGWHLSSRRQVTLALAEALGWLIAQGLVMRDPNQTGEWYVLTRRARQLRTRADVEAYRKGEMLPRQLLQPRLAEKVHHLFVRGDHDVAVFQAFKELEVAVRAACALGNEVIGKAVMTRAFNVDNGPLADMALVPAEREAEMALFVGAIGHAKNPASHRDVKLRRDEAARLIVFASYLLAIVEERSL